MGKSAVCGLPYFRLSMKQSLYINKVYVLFVLCLLLLGCHRNRPSASSSITTSIRFVEEDHNVGRLQSDTITCNFQFTNTGERPLVINKIETSCRCITAEKPQAPVMPGKSDVIRVRYVREQGQTGRFFRSIIVYGNASSQPITLSITGEN